MDPTVVQPGQRALIEQQAGFSLRDADPAALRFVVTRSKEAGNAAFKRKGYAGRQATPALATGTTASCPTTG